MYNPAYFQITDPDVIYNVIENHGFATLFSQHNGLPYATHLPLLLDRGKQILHGHFARPNPQWADLGEQTVLAVFQGPHCYISPSWYETNTAVPTWNYVTVHVYGWVELIADEQELWTHMLDLVSKYEAPSSSYRPDQLDPMYVSGVSKGVQGFKLHITRLEGKAKLSQNHPAERRQRVIRQLQSGANGDEQSIAAWMQRQEQHT